MTTSLSNLIKGYSTTEIEPFVINSDQSEKGVQLNEQIRNVAPVGANMGTDEHAADDVLDGFQEGLSYSQVTPEEYDNILTGNEMEEDLDADDIDVQNDEASLEAASIIERAQEEALQIRAQAEAQMEDLKAQTVLQAKEEGRQQGLEAAAEEIEQMKTQLLADQDVFRQQLQAEQEDALLQLEPKFAEVLCDLLERLTGVVVKGHSEVILYLINNAMRGIDNSHSFVISVSDADFAYVNQHKQEIYGYLNPGVEIELFQDSKLEKNQCKIETDNGMVDLSLDVQLSQMIKSLMMLNA